MAKQEHVSIQYGKPIYGHTLEMAKLYSAFSNIEKTHILCNEYEYDSDLSEIINVIEAGAKRRFEWTYEKTPKKVVDRDNTRNIVVCFSGGKDSTATALKMKELGWTVFLFYIKGINKSYPDEYTRAQTISKYLNMPLYTMEIRQTGKTTFYDNPIKNQLIASLALDYAIERNIGVDVAFGDFTTDCMENSCFNEDWSDCQEMWNAYIKYVRKWIPNANVHTPFKTYLETMDIVGKDVNLLNMVQGCVLPHRFRSARKIENEKKYNIQLLNNRCGSCWKCCMEYIYYAEKGIVRYDKAFYKHCLDVLMKKAKDLKPNINNNSIGDVYSAFLYKDYTKSKYYQDTFKR